MKIDTENFNDLVERAMLHQEEPNIRPVIEKELLHYDILFALDSENLLNNLVFQGGTSLRLCYGAPRLSEDLDFVGGKDFEDSHLKTIKTCVEDYISRRYGLEVYVKNPSELSVENRGDSIAVKRWQIRVVTSPKRPDLPKQMIKIEIANIPAYTQELKAIHLNYNFLPDGYNDTLIKVESLSEIMADKVIALPSCHKTIRYRDIWDLNWLIKQNVPLDMELVLNKINDYKLKDYSQSLQNIIKRLPDLIKGPEFKSQMQRFIPMSVQKRTLEKDNFTEHLENELISLFQEVKKGIE